LTTILGRCKIALKNFLLSKINAAALVNGSGCPTLATFLFLWLGWEDIYNYNFYLKFFMVFSRHNPYMQPLAQMLYHSSVTSSAPHSPTLLVHGGAWAIPADAAADHLNGVRQALETGYALLSRGASALDAVEAAVTVLEDDPTFDAGRGSFLTSDGRVQLDALLMDGGRLKAGGVACVERLRNPIQAARLVLEQSHHVYFVGDGAEQFAAAHGMTLINNSELVLDRERERLTNAKLREAAGFGDDTFSGLDTPLLPILHDDKSPETAFPSTSLIQNENGPKGHDTVGAVALDSRGNLAAATSTGGTLNKTPGRVGDSSLIGCGCYADNLSAAVSLTGWGEPIMKLVLGKWATDRVASGTAPDIAAREAIAYLFNRLGGHGGIILLGPDGRFGLAHNTPAMAWGLATSNGLQTGLTV
jgi:beta-aspartyl-peptidase (threonine type)